jgi:hypothetical protein
LEGISPRLWAREPFLTRSQDGTEAVASTGPLVRFGDRAAPASFKAWFDRPEMPSIAMAIERVAGKYECTQIQVAAPPDGIVTRELLSAVAVPALVRTAVAHATHAVFEITNARELGRARIFWLMGEDLDRDDYEFLDLDDDELERQMMLPVVPGWVAELSPSMPDFQLGDALAIPALGPDLAPSPWIDRSIATVEDARRTRAASRLARLKRVADVYNAAYNSGKPTTRAVMDDQKASKEYAKQLVREARREGFLPPTTTGKKRGATDLLSDA